VRDRKLAPAHLRPLTPLQRHVAVTPFPSVAD
jgi:hypothetical protein